jgi:hypothetical protein
MYEIQQYTADHISHRVLTNFNQQYQKAEVILMHAT